VLYAPRRRIPGNKKQSKSESRRPCRNREHGLRSFCHAGGLDHLCGMLTEDGKTASRHRRRLRERQAGFCTTRGVRRSWIVVNGADPEVGDRSLRIVLSEADEAVPGPNAVVKLCRPATFATPVPQARARGPKETRQPRPCLKEAPPVSARFCRRTAVGSEHGRRSIDAPYINEAVTLFLPEDTETVEPQHVAVVKRTNGSAGPHSSACHLAVSASGRWRLTG